MFSVSTMKKNNFYPTSIFFLIISVVFLPFWLLIWLFLAKKLLSHTRIPVMGGLKKFLPPSLL